MGVSRDEINISKIKYQISKLTEEKNILKYGILLLLFFLPLIYWLPVFNPYENPKFWFFIISVQVLIVIYFLPLKGMLKPSFVKTTAVRRQRLCRRREGQKQVQHDKKNSLGIKNNLTVFPRDLLTIAIIAFGLINLIADVFGIDPKISLLGSEYRHQGFITLLAGIFFYFLVRSQKISLSKDNPYIKIVLASTFFICLFALWQGIAFYLFHDFSIPTYQGRIVGTFGNPNFLGGYLAMMLPFILFSSFNCHSELGSESKNERILKHPKSTGYYIAAQVQYDIVMKPVFVLMILTVIFFTGSRSGMLAAGFVMAVCLMYHLSGILRTPGRCQAKVPFLLFILILFLFSSLLSNSGFSKNSRLQSLFNRESVWDNRNLIWTEGLKAFSSRPLLGYGQENFELVFPEKRMMRVDNAHNIFLEVLISSGTIGLFIFIIVLYSAFKRGGLAVKISLAAFLVTAQFNPLSISQIAFFWFLLGIVPQDN